MPHWLSNCDACMYGLIAACMRFNPANRHYPGSVHLEQVYLQVMEHGATVKKLSAVEVAKEAAEGSVRASADAARSAEAALVRPTGCAGACSVAFQSRRAARSVMPWQL